MDFTGSRCPLRDHPRRAQKNCGGGASVSSPRSGFFPPFRLCILGDAPQSLLIAVHAAAVGGKDDFRPFEFGDDPACGFGGHAQHGAHVFPAEQITVAPRFIVQDAQQKPRDPRPRRRPVDIFVIHSSARATD